MPARLPGTACLAGEGAAATPLLERGSRCRRGPPREAAGAGKCSAGRTPLRRSALSRDRCLLASSRTGLVLPIYILPPLRAVGGFIGEERSLVENTSPLRIIANTNSSSPATSEKTGCCAQLRVFKSFAKLLPGLITAPPKRSHRGEERLGRQSCCGRRAGAAPGLTPRGCSCLPEPRGPQKKRGGSRGRRGRQGLVRSGLRACSRCLRPRSARRGAAHLGSAAAAGGAPGRRARSAAARSAQAPPGGAAGPIHSPAEAQAPPARRGSRAAGGEGVAGPGEPCPPRPPSRSLCVWGCAGRSRFPAAGALADGARRPRASLQPAGSPPVLPAPRSQGLAACLGSQVAAQPGGAIGERSALLRYI
ncbi:uncharacterized protein LOC142600022 [Balearica regulorum gibbericeps]|uniref:uncharacterized protein LOC142600022 n=1 Tax=Balearica regulorum gibbericeps TaxID=100784 RepID=UPI003F605DC9